MATSDYSSVAGLDAADGLRRAAGDSRLYASLLRQFVTGHAGAAEEIEANLRRGDDAVAERVAHSVKGVAGNIGATAVQAAAADVEKAIRMRAGQEHITTLKQRLASELVAMVALLEPLLESDARDPNEADAPPADPATVKVSAGRVMALLEQSDPSAIAVIESERQTLRSLFTREELAAFERLVTAYSFDDAIDCLRSAVGAREAR
jgi:two-component system sensor histidine kinase/response regulator